MPDAKSLAVVTIIDQRKIITILLQSEVVKQHDCDFVISFRKQDSREVFRNRFQAYIDSPCAERLRVILETGKISASY
jgi:hypothetical protein